MSPLQSEEEEEDDQLDDPPTNGAVVDLRFDDKMKLVDAELLTYSNVGQLSSISIDQVTKNRIHMNPLEWWKKNRVSYPHLANLARKVLCIPTTSAPSKRVLSTAGLTITQARASLTPEHAENLFLQDAIPIMDTLMAIENVTPTRLTSSSSSR